MKKRFTEEQIIDFLAEAKGTEVIKFRSWPPAWATGNRPSQRLFHHALKPLVAQSPFLIHVLPDADGSYVFMPVLASDRVPMMGVTRPPTSAAGSHATC
jgi:hypothetical protein